MSPFLSIGGAILLFWVACALFGPALVPCNPYADDLAHTLAAPSGTHWFGTDQIGRDIFSRIIVGARPILSIAPAATLLATLLGTTLGLVAGYAGGLVDTIINRLIEVVLALPLIVVALLVLAALGPSMIDVTAVIALIFTPLIARTVRSAVRAECALDYVSAAQLRDERTLYILFGEILPNVLPLIVVEVTVRLGYAIFTVASLSFLGFGMQPPSPDWGLSIAENYGLIVGGYWWTVTFAAAATASLVIAVNLVAEAFADGVAMSALALHDLCVSYGGRPVLHGVSLDVAPGECLGLVGESGCGKSSIALAALRALPRGGVVTHGRVEIGGRNILTLDRTALRQVWAREVAMVYQDPSRALNPTMTIAAQLREVGAARDALADMRIADPDRVLRAYPHQLSGGMQQRVVIAMALARSTALLVLDEPTTGLDATVEADIMALIDARRRKAGTAVLLISHNLALVGRIADRIGVLYAGVLVEEGPAARVLAASRHPYTDALLQCLPRQGLHKSQARLQTIPGALPAPGARPAGCVFAPRCQMTAPQCLVQSPDWRGEAGHSAACHFDPPFEQRRAAAAPDTPAVDDAPLVLDARALAKTYPGQVHAVRDICLTLRAGETLGVVGESGSGKTTLARMLLGLIAPDAGGTILLDGQTLPASLRARTRAQRRALQIIFQNPDSALNRAQTVRTILQRPLLRLARVARRDLPARVDALADAVRLSVPQRSQFPRALSGGQKQRVAIARALAGEPRVVICDEPTSALDVSVQAAILNLLADLQQRTGVGLIFISHDLNVVRYMADRVAVLYRGEIVQVGTTAEVFDGEQHPYTAKLLAGRTGGAVPALPDPPSFI